MLIYEEQSTDDKLTQHAGNGKKKKGKKKYVECNVPLPGRGQGRGASVSAMAQRAARQQVARRQTPELRREGNLS